MDLYFYCFSTENSLAPQIDSNQIQQYFFLDQLKVSICVTNRIIENISEITCLPLNYRRLFLSSYQSKFFYTPKPLLVFPKNKLSIYERIDFMKTLYIDKDTAKFYGNIIYVEKPNIPLMMMCEHENLSENCPLYNLDPNFIQMVVSASMVILYEEDSPKQNFKNYFGTFYSIYQNPLDPIKNACDNLELKPRLFSSWGECIQIKTKLPSIALNLYSSLEQFSEADGCQCLIAIPFVDKIPKQYLQALEIDDPNVKIPDKDPFFGLSIYKLLLHTNEELFELQVNCALITEVANIPFILLKQYNETLSPRANAITMQIEKPDYNDIPYFTFKLKDPKTQYTFKQLYENQKNSNILSITSVWSLGIYHILYKDNASLVLGKMALFQYINRANIVNYNTHYIPEK